MRFRVRTLIAAAILWSAGAVAEETAYQPWASVDDTTKIFAAEPKALTDLGGDFVVRRIQVRS